MQYKSTLLLAGLIAAMSIQPQTGSARSLQGRVPAKAIERGLSKATIEKKMKDEARSRELLPVLNKRAQLADKKASTPFYEAATRLSSFQRVSAARRAPMALGAANLLAYVNYDSNEVYTSNMVNIALPGGEFESKAVYDYYYPNCGIAKVDGLLYGLCVDSFWGFVFVDGMIINPEDWTYETVSLDESMYCAALTNDPAGDGAMGLFVDLYSGVVTLSKVSVPDFGKTDVADLNNYYFTLAAGNDGFLYGVADDNNLYKINPTTAEESLVGPTGFSVVDAAGQGYGQCAAIDPKTGVMYWAAINGDGDQSGLYVVDVTTGAASLALDYGLMQINSLLVDAAAAEDGAPNYAENVTANFVDLATTGTISFTAPTATFAGAALEGDLAYTVTVDGSENYTGSCAPGAAVEVEVTVAEGNHAASVVVSNAAGNSPKAKVSFFVGQDTPKAPASVEFAYADGQATVSWEAVTEGVNGGYLGEVVYNVYDANGLMWAEHMTTTSVTFAFNPEGMGNYKFVVEAVAGGKASAQTSSNGVVIGSAMNVPVYLDYSDPATTDLSTIIDANEDGKTWAYSSSDKSVRYSYSSINAADDWMLTPAINLTAGRTYVLSYKAWAQNATSYPEKLEITVGQGATIAAQTQVIEAEHEVVGTNASDPFEVEFTVAASGEYNIGFHCVSDADMFALNLASVSVEAGPLPEAPAAPSLAVVPAAEGSLEYTLNITLPTQTIAGGELGNITKILLNAAGEEVVLSEGYTAGQVVAYTASVEEAGTYTWTAVCYNEAENGLKSSVSAFLGQDTPAPVLDAVLTDLVDAVRIDWSPVTVGANGGYINPAEISYEIYSIVDGYIGELLGTTEECTFTVPFNTTVGEMAILQYALQTVGTGGVSGYYGSDALIVGQPDVLPWIEEFVNTSMEKFLWVERNTSEMSVSISQDGNGGCIAFTSLLDNVQGSLITGKINLAGALNPEVIFSVKGDETAAINVELITMDGNRTVLGTVNCTADWSNNAVVIPAQYVAEPYVMIAFTAQMATAGSMIFVDNLNVRDVLEYNLSLLLSAPASLVKGNTAYATATVTNEGSAAVQPVTVKFVVNGEEQTLTYDKALETFQSVDFPVELEASILSQEEAIEIEAEVIYDLDLKPEDNVASAIVELKDPTVAPVEDLAATLTDGGIELTWTAAEGAVAVQIEDVESFEDGAYPNTPYLADGSIPSTWNTVGTCGDWTMYDLDGGGSYGWQGVEYQFSGYSYGWAVIDLVSMFGADASVVPHSGNKVFMSMSSPDRPNDDWLISPELPGMAQTISFWYSELTSDYGPEKFEVYYSTTDKEVASFVKVASESVASAAWTEYSFDVPEGTKYFAIRCISQDIFGFLVDDISYSAGTSAPVSFNIYRDGEFLDETTECSYTDAEPGHVYAVTAVYANGAESAPAFIDIDAIVGIETVETEVAAAPVYNTVGIRVNEPKAHGIYVVGNKKVAK